METTGEPFEERDDHGRVLAVGAPSGLGFLVVRLDPEVSQDGVEVRAGYEVEGSRVLEILAKLNQKSGWASFAATAEGLDYYWWLGGDETPTMEGNINGRGFSGPIDPVDGRPPTDLTLDQLLPEKTRAALEAMRPLLEAVAASVEPPVTDPPTGSGPGAQDAGRPWWRDWRQAKHLCWGLAAAAGATCFLGGPIIGIAGAGAFGVAGSKCYEVVSHGGG